MTMLKRELEIEDKRSVKYCTIVLNETVLMVTDGTIGKSGEKQIRDSRSTLFATKQKARDAYENLVQQKLDEGYVDVDEPSGVKPTAKKPALKTETLVLRYGDSDIPYNVVSAQFDSTESKLDICVGLGIADKSSKEYPPEILIRIANLVIEGQNHSFQVRDEHRNWDDSEYDDRPHAYVYSGFHHVHVSAWVDIESHQETEMIVTIKIETDDVIRYDKKAITNHIVGVCALARTPKEDMWAP
jgi:predicted DNA-binding WGR domain protein